MDQPPRPDEGGAAAIDDHAKPRRVARQHYVTGAGKGRRDAGKARAVGGGLEVRQDAHPWPVAGHRLDRGQGKPPASPAMRIEGARLGR